jgi:glyoxylase-like metal-dependent hydrolase (beta-lactamase superfamily II)
MQITDHVHALRVPFQLPLPDGRRLERFVYAYILVERRALLVDAGVRGYAKELTEYLRTIGVAASDVAWTLLTHTHPDHIGGLAGVIEATGCRTATHADAAPWVTDPERQFRERPVPGFHDLVEGPVAPSQLLGGDREIGGDGVPRIEVIETPGHAPGHVAFFHEPDGVLICGDALPQPGAMPIYDDVGASVQSIRRLQQASTRAKVLLSSWDEPCRAGEIAGRLRAALDAVQRMHDAVRQGSAEEGSRDPARLVPAVVRRLGLPSFAVNPLTARTVAAHLSVASEDRVI